MNKKSAISNEQPVLEINHLSVQVFGKKTAKTIVSDVSLEVYPGETVCVVGESGSGKSVSSFAVMGLLPKDILKISSGQVSLNGSEISNLSEAQLRKLRGAQMAMVFQEPMTALNPVQKVGRQIEEVLRLHTPLERSARKARVLEMLKAVHLPDPERIYGSYPHQLSGGQRQRIVIAMALILKPSLLIADEPTTALDVTTQKQILLLIKELQEEQGTGVLFITHDFGVVADIADRIVVMKSGQVVETGTKDEILGNPKDEYTRMLVASVPSLVPRDERSVKSNSVLEVQGLDKIYETGRSLFKKNSGVHAVKRANFSISEGEIKGIVGESGSGKSTVARCIVRLETVTSGSVLLRGKDLVQLSAHEMRQYRRKVQIVFQDPYRSLNPRRTVGNSLIEGLLNYGMDPKEARKKVQKALEIVGMDVSVLSRYPHQFSGGQRQRLCIARAVVMEPELLIADESVSALDVSVQAQVLKLFEEIRDQLGTAILFITHDLRVAATVCDSIIVMQKGKIVEAGAAAKILSQPETTYTQELIAAAPGRHWDFQHFRPMRA